MIAFAVAVRENSGIFGYHRKVAEFDSAFAVDIAAMVPGNVIADLDKVTVIKPAAFVCNKAVAAFFEQLFGNHRPERNGKLHVDAERDSVHHFP